MASLRESVKVLFNVFSSKFAPPNHMFQKLNGADTMGITN
jgi:hypothetical protein